MGTDDKENQYSFAEVTVRVWGRTHERVRKIKTWCGQPGVKAALTCLGDYVEKLQGEASYEETTTDTEYKTVYKDY